MKKSIYITGIAGSGKSTISKALKALGYETYDIEDDRYGLFIMVRKDTGERYMDYDNTDLNEVNNARWVCDKDKLKNLVNNQVNDLAFYCGIASDNVDLMPLFDLSILLQTKPEVLDRRLLSREGTDNYGNTEAGRLRILSHKEESEKKFIKAGMVAVDANSNPEDVARNIIKVINNL